MATRNLNGKAEQTANMRLDGWWRGEQGGDTGWCWRQVGRLSVRKRWRQGARMAQEIRERKAEWEVRNAGRQRSR